MILTRVLLVKWGAKITEFIAKLQTVHFYDLADNSRESHPKTRTLELMNGITMYLCLLGYPVIYVKDDTYSILSTNNKVIYNQKAHRICSN